MRYFRHIIGVLILVFFVASFFIGLRINPSFTDIANSPYGLFTYLIITILTAFIPSVATIPVVTTATFIWGPWIAGVTAVIGWTIGSIVEYYAALYAIEHLIKWFNGDRLGKKIQRVRDALSFWKLVIVRTFIPPFVFGLVGTKFSHYIWASIIVYIPLAAAGAVGGELLKNHLEQIQPLLLGGALILLIFTIDFLFASQEGSGTKKIK